MADENPSVPPKINPLGPRPSTLKLKPIVRPTVGGLKTGLKLPPKPGLTTMGLKLPPKSGAAAPAAAPAAAAPAPAPAPAAEAAKSQTSSLEALKSVTQNLKSITAPIPQQAILHKTGIIADPGLTAAQMAAAKARTSRISLSDAMGVAPVKNEPTPMKTIRIKRPVDIPGATESMKPAEPAAPVAATPVPEAPAAEAAEVSPSVTQKKTLKISRPGGAVRPAGKFGIKKPTTQATTVAKKAPEAAAAPAEGEVSDIPDLPQESAFVPANGALAAAAGMAPNADVEKDVPKGVAIMGLIVQFAACVAMALLVYKFYVDIYETSPF